MRIFARKQAAFLSAILPMSVLFMFFGQCGMWRVPCDFSHPSPRSLGRGLMEVQNVDVRRRAKATTSSPRSGSINHVPRPSITPINHSHPSKETAHQDLALTPMG
jgi:hypothetical protein